MALYWGTPGLLGSLYTSMIVRGTRIIHQNDDSSPSTISPLTAIFKSGCINIYIQSFTKTESDRTFLTERSTYSQLLSPLKESQENHFRLQQSINHLFLLELTSILNFSRCLLRLTSACHKSDIFLVISSPEQG